MAATFDEWENTSATKVLSEEARIKTLIEEMQDAVIGINEKEDILFVNTAAKKILNFDGKQVIGHSVKGLIKNNNLLKLILDNKDPDGPLKVYKDGKTFYFHQKNLEIFVPNLKPNPFDAVQFSGYTAGMIYILRNAEEFEVSREQ
jgi:PAS domain S-box-containing protein